jgi:hypothetical protein
MLLVYANEQAMENMSADERARSFEGRRLLMEEANQRGIFRGADALHPTSTATTVRVQNGRPLVTDGPFAETKEQLAGYIILECKDLDEALEWAARIPVACGGCELVEVRPIPENQPHVA